MRLVEPTDFEILEVLDEEGRNNAINIAHILEKNRQYLNTRLPQLADYGLVQRIGPAQNSGLYEITDRGRVALAHRETYSSDTEAFEAVLEREARQN